LLLWPGRLRLVFLLAAVPGALAVLALLGVRETSTATPTTTSTPNTTSNTTSTATRPPGSLLAAIFLFTLGNSTDALLLLRAQSLGVRTELVPVLWSMLHVVRAASSWPL